MKKDFLSEIKKSENIINAYVKAKSNVEKYAMTKSEIFEWEINIEEKIKFVRNKIDDLINGSYRIELKYYKIPKKLDSIRDYFYVSFDEQVLWLCFLNVIGPLIDRIMPRFSFGNRLWRLQYKKDKNWEYGEYNIPDGNIYKTYNQSYKLYRRYQKIFLYKCFNGTKNKYLEYENLSETEKEIIEYESNNNKDNNTWVFENFKFGYTKNIDVWKNKFPLFYGNNFNEKINKELFYIKIDIEKYFYKIEKEKLFEEFERIIEFIINLKENSWLKEDKKLIIDLFKKLSNYELIESDNKVREEIDDRKNVPVGLLTAGFISNIYLFSFDLKMEEKIKEKNEKGRIFGFFRYVDDMVIISSDFEDLLNQFFYIKKELENLELNISLNKLKPNIFKFFMNGNKKEVIKILTKEIEDENESRKQYLKIMYGLEENYAEGIKNEFIVTKENYDNFKTNVFDEMSQINNKLFDFIGETEMIETSSRIKNLIKAYYDKDKIEEKTRLSSGSYYYSKMIRALIDWDIDNKGEDWLSFEKDLNLSKLSKELSEKKKKEKRELKEYLIYNSLNDIKYSLLKIPSKMKIFKRLIEIIFYAREYYEYISLEEDSKDKKEDNKYKKEVSFIKNLEELYNQIIQRYKKEDETEIEYYLKTEITRFMTEEILKLIKLNKPIDFYKKEIEGFLNFKDFFENEESQNLNKIVEKIYLIEKYRFFNLINYIIKNELVNLNKEKIKKIDDIYNQIKKILNKTTSDTVENINYYNLIYLSNNEKFEKNICSFINISNDIFRDKEKYLLYSLYKRIKEKKQKKELIMTISKRLNFDFENRYFKIMIYDYIYNYFDENEGEDIPCWDILISNFLNQEDEFVKILKDQINYLINKSKKEEIKNKYLINYIFNTLNSDLKKINFVLVNFLNFNEKGNKNIELNNYLKNLLFSEVTVKKDNEVKIERIEYTKTTVGLLLNFLFETNKSFDFLNNEYENKIKYNRKNVWKYFMENTNTNSRIINLISDLVGKYSKNFGKRNKQAPYKSSLEGKSIKEVLEEIKEEIEKTDRNKIILKDLPIISKEEKEELKPFARIGIIQPNINIFKEDKNKNLIYFNEKNISYNKKVKNMIFTQIKMGLELFKNLDTDLIIMPEFTLPNSRINSIYKWVKENRIPIITGTEYKYNKYKNEVQNRQIIFWPYEDIFTLKISNYKSHFNHQEKNMFNKKNISIKEDKSTTIYKSNTYGSFSSLICYDALDLDKYMILQGKINNLFIISHNRDVETYIGVSEMMSKILYTNVIVANTGVYGGSVARSPYYERYKREILTFKGNDKLGFPVFEIPIKHLDDHIKNVISNKKSSENNKNFKTFPPNFEKKYRDNQNL
ncbi:RNA-directed DNA polymerase [Geotoga petraea]|nr:RNA-directed DNA polymerase [Geotoga petraea]